MNPNLLQSTPILAAGTSNAALTTFLIYTMAVFGLAWLSNRLMRSKSFLSEYFLGSRSLGVWAFALTFAATSASGGSFTGFPSKIYTHGWVLGLWIGSYIVVPICAMGLLGKRINQVARISGCITVPDVLRDRFRSPMFGLLAVSLIVFFMSFNLVGQFKAGSEILKTLLQDVDAFNAAVGWVAGVKSNIGFLRQVDADYLLCLVVFAAAVIVYTAYGGFHAVVWTDVMQGLVMVVGVVIMLPLAIYQVGGMGRATTMVAEMTPPRLGLAHVMFDPPLDHDFAVSSPWFLLPGESDGQTPRLFRISRTLAIPANQSTVEHVKFVELTTEEEINRYLQRLKREWGPDRFNAKLDELQDQGFCWLNDAPELVSASVIITLNKEYEFGHRQRGVYVSGPGPDPPSLPKNPGTLSVQLSAADTPVQIQVLNAEGKLEHARMSVGAKTLLALNEGEYELQVSADGFEPFSQEIKIVEGGTATIDVALAAAASGKRDALAPQSDGPMSDGFLPLSLAISFFFMWAISGAGQPSSMVRLMAFNSSRTLRRSIFTVAMYYSMIYFPLVVIFCCARVILPGMDLESDRIMPQMAVTLTNSIGQGWLAGLLVAAPFAAVMSTVDSFLLMISSALVRDIYQRNINPNVSEKTIKYMSYGFTLLIGSGAMLGAVNPPRFLQDIIVYTGSGLAACFLAPMVFALYWPRVNSVGCISGMTAGFAAHLAMYVGGIFVNGSFFDPYRLFNFSPIIIGLLVSFVATFVVTRMTAPPPEDLVRKYFYKKAD